MVLLQAFLVKLEEKPKVVAVSWVLTDSPQDGAGQAMAAWQGEGVAPKTPEEAKEYLVHLVPVGPIQIPGKVEVAQSIPQSKILRP